MDLSEQTQVAQTIEPVQGREITLRLKALFRDALNVRRKTSMRSVEELAALIYSQGLLQNVIVRTELAGKKARAVHFSRIPA